MSIRNLLVAFNGTETSKAALRLASVLATQHDAYLTALFAHTIPHYQVRLEPYLAAEVIAALKEQADEQSPGVKRAFKAECETLGIGDRCRFMVAEMDPDRCFAEFSRTYDLTIIGQPDEDRSQNYRQPHPDLLALHSGRAVLVAPRNFSARTLGSHALLAWDCKRAAARALSDAIDLLEAHPKVTVLHVGESDADVRKPGRDIMEHLSRHDLSAELLVKPQAGRSISEIVLETAMTSGAGLLVMGAYEHSRFSEMLLGGVTRDVLAAVNIPVMIAH